MRLIQQLQAVLSADLLKPEWRGSSNPLAGHCYAASEALYHLLGGRASGWVPRVATFAPGRTHWWLEKDGVVADPTAGQFDDPFPYHLGKGCGFLTREPSKRAREIMRRMAETAGNDPARRSSRSAD